MKTYRTWMNKLNLVVLAVLAVAGLGQSAQGASSSITVTLPAYGGVNSYELTVTGDNVTVNNNKIEVEAGENYSITYRAIAGSGWKVVKPNPNPKTITSTSFNEEGVATVGMVEFQQKAGAETTMTAPVTVTVVKQDGPVILLEGALAAGATVTVDYAAPIAAVVLQNNGTEVASGNFSVSYIDADGNTIKLEDNVSMTVAAGDSKSWSVPTGLAVGTYGCTATWDVAGMGTLSVIFTVKVQAK